MKLLVPAAVRLSLFILPVLPGCTEARLAASSFGPPKSEYGASMSSLDQPLQRLADDAPPASDDDDDDDDGETEIASQAPSPLDEPGLVRLLAATGFPTKAIPRLVCTAKFESDLNPLAENHNRNGTQDTGLFQINDIWLKPCGLSRAELLDPATNARCAFKVFKERGLNAWNGFKRQKATCLRYRV